MYLACLGSGVKKKASGFGEAWGEEKKLKE
jgi:hypothetical protein